MSHVTLGQQGVAAAEAKDWDGAITKLSKALQSSLNPGWLLARSKSLVNLHRYNEALDDANLAWHAAFQRNKRPLMIEANYRRAVAYFRMGQFANADACCIYAMRLVKKGPAVDKEDPVAHLKDPATGRWTATVEDAMKEARTDEINNVPAAMAMSESSNNTSNAQEWRMASTLRIQALSAMAKLPADDAARTATVQAKPEEKKLADLPGNVEETKRAAPSSTAPTQTPTKPQVPSDTPLRLQDFQSNTNMTVSIFSKGVNKEKLKVDFQPHSVHLDALMYPSGDEKDFQLDLWGEIDTTASKYTVTPNKVELNLVKKSPGKWAKLTSNGTPRGPAEPAVAPAISTGEKPAAETPSVVKSASTAAPAYPSSSRTGTKNWDKLDLGEDGKDDEDPSDVNGFFKQIFKNASPDAQRAMMKSFTESNGTSLSTNWDEVKNGTVEMVPPDGLQPKKWD
ncbi:SGT1 and CS domain containing protein [Cordyceps fumosorosea ARSEF 2679]|uniref:SGT1 and CS domain containing protein n=1 Tax=Cordyceps fumosorosea (strain ARSEF 2679) TaxID=1081104 RepID=A0A162LLI3_CORFA|nr:SGT1 and CS domain containing protein [Cordyceps fumosorosea ARSEF 2679]OAA72384.1 SGT1 and CS domain containing protein [Cordyceps fumosorosea ARSEF 2679]